MQPAKYAKRQKRRKAVLGSSRCFESCIPLAFKQSRIFGILLIPEKRRTAIAADHPTRAGERINHPMALHPAQYQFGHSPSNDSPHLAARKGSMKASQDCEQLRQRPASRTIFILQEKISFSCLDAQNDQFTTGLTAEGQ
jgi:hypothetical protein